MIKNRSLPAILRRMIEPILAGVGFLGLFLSLSYLAPGGPQGSDVLGYITVGIVGSKAMGGFYNRYFHILLQRIFIKLAPTPLQGAQFYWAFLVASVCLLVYLGARLFSKRSHPLHGLIALGLFLSIAAIADSDGITQVDLTAMFVVALLVVTYLLSARVEHRSKWLIMLFGLLFYLAFKTKETTLPAGILIVGLGFITENKFNWLFFRKNFLYLLAGAAAGLVFFAIWTWLAVGDPLFGLRPSEFIDYLSSYGQTQTGGQNGLGNWYDSFFFTTLLVPFILYLLSGLRTNDLAVTRRLVWLVPLALIILLSISIGNKWGFDPRFVFPVLPAICLLVPQLFNFELPTARRDQLAAAILFLAGLVVLVLVRLLMKFLLPKLGWNITTYVNVVLYPVLITCLLAIYYFSSRPGIKTSTVTFILLVGLLVSPLVRNFKVLFITHDNLKNSQIIFYPFSAFSNQLVYSPRMEMYISANIWSILGNPFSTKNVDEVVNAFDIYFNVNSSRDNFTIDSPNQDNILGVLNKGYGYILLSQASWQSLVTDPQVLLVAEQKYQIFHDPKNLLILLEAR